MRKKKQEMLKTQIECQKVRALPLFLFLFLIFSSLEDFSLMLLHLPAGFNKPPGAEPRDETRGEGQHHEDPEGADGEDRTAAERNEPQPRLTGIRP